ncbi:MAG TPA: enhanced serine sensitivity protein SseB C-terminal domain-containing protein [Arenimonas sp.]|uniref:enhanced serine sensitivity protein SseB C-terminal domain-containing protein n=1 Tax=Arenimonas sp. TaxID=1872635 RepID=UPI002D7F7F16|nr:enhanced serine sensitivity protein SseB C-terminal domain-containing protein [Arenimonas sp.]HEU0153184.1 enhanced serine sensitivity protein SseB C-terminal domain-containing protein [Arenimonas sp.]
MAISQKVVDRLLAESLLDSTKEPAFLRALLDAMLYAHTPKNDSPNRTLRFLQFVTPDGITALPVFTDRGKAEFASKGHARVVSVLGRQLLEATRGATLAINPNDRWCMLYPEEISELLSTGSAAVIFSEHIPDDTAIATALPANPPHWLIETLQGIFAAHPSVERAYLVEMRSSQRMDVSRLVVAVAMPTLIAERVCRAAVTEVQLKHPNPDCIVDLTRIDPTADLPPWLAHLSPEPIYRREWAQALRGHPPGTSGVI